MVNRKTLLFLLPVMLLSACAHKKDTGYKTDIKELGNRITLNPAHMPVSVHWVNKAMGIADSRTPGPTDVYLIAILDYDAGSGKQYFDSLRQEKEVESSGMPYYEDKDAESGYPASVAKCFNEHFYNVKVYNADLFARYAYKGWFFLTDDWKIFIYLQAT